MRSKNEMNEMVFQLAVGGTLPKDERIVQLVRRQLEMIRGRLAGEGGTARIQVLISPSYTAPEWQLMIKEAGVSTFGFCKSGDPDWTGFCEKSVWEDTPLRSVVGEAMCNRADLVLAVWNEDVAECLGASWELIQIARKGKTPCLWISSKTGIAYWSKDSYFEIFDPAALDRLCKAHQAVAPLSFPDAERPLPLLSLAAALRHRFLNKYRAVRPETEPVEDRILRDDFSLGTEHTGAERVRRSILEQFRRFDQSAVTLNAQYQSILYWRAVLPLLASIFLAIGFYAETLLSITGIPGTAVTRLAGIGFLIHGLLNLYVYLLSGNNAVKGKHRAFLQNRCIAEILRVLIHFVPYGIYPDLRGMCNGSEGTRAAIQQMILGAEPDIQRIDGSSSSYALRHIREMLQDQIAYHIAAADRYGRISNRLNKWHKAIVGIGFVVLILRAVLQFYVSVSPLQGNINGVSLNGYVRSFANMVALMLPAWAGHFSAKLTLCNFSFNCENHSRMAERLSHTLAQVEQLETVEGGVPIDVLHTLSGELAQIMIVGDTQIWERKYEGSIVTRL